MENQNIKKKEKEQASNYKNKMINKTKLLIKNTDDSKTTSKLIKQSDLYVNNFKLNFAKGDNIFRG